jgi:predicted PurR-regulated permease PerM
VIAVATSADWSSLRRIPPRVLWRVVVIVAAALLVAFEARALFVLFGGVLLAVFLKTLAELICRHTRLPYVATVVALVLLHLGGMVAIVVIAGPSLVAQATTLAHTLPSALQQAFERARHVLGDGATIPLPRIEDLRPEAKSVVAGASGAVTGTVEIVGGLVVAAFVGLYGALSPDAYTNIALALVTQERQARAREVLYETGRRLGRWLIGRAVAMAFVGIATGIGLHFLHVPLAVSLGILAGVLAFVEYIGAIASAVPPILLALGESPTRALGVVLLFTGVHVIEGYLLTPFLARKAVHFPPAYTLAAQTVFGALFGVMGLTFATPTCIVAATLVEMLYVQDVLGKRTV